MAKARRKAAPKRITKKPKARKPRKPKAARRVTKIKIKKIKKIKLRKPSKAAKKLSNKKMKKIRMAKRRIRKMLEHIPRIKRIIPKPMPPPAFKQQPVKPKAPLQSMEIAAPPAPRTPPQTVRAAPAPKALVQTAKAMPPLLPKQQETAPLPPPQMPNEKALFWAQLTNKIQAAQTTAQQPKQAQTAVAPVSPPSQGILLPAFDLLPPWEDRERLRRFMTEEGLQLLVPARGSPDSDSALRLLGSQHKQSNDPGYFVTCCSDSNGRVVAAMDCCMAGNTLLILRSRVSTRVEKMQLHLLLYAAALAKARPESVFYMAPRSSLSPELAGKLIFLGRGLGMSAIPANNRILFIRRMGRESEPVADGQEVAASLRSIKKFFDSGIEAVISEIERKGMLPLVQLPNSPDRPEHVHELKEAVLALGLPVNGLESVLDTIRLIYVEDRRDITPDAL